MAEQRARAATRARALIVRTAAAALVWWVLTEGNPGAPVLGAAIVILAVAASFVTLPATGTRVNARRAVGFGAWFLRQSVLGGVDVAIRALHPRLPLDPGLIRVSVGVKSDAARIVLVAAVSLVPGMLAARLEEDQLVVHALDARRPVAASVSEIERRLRAVLME